MEDQFRAWWQESYCLPPGPHSVMTHVAWGEHLLATRPNPPSLKSQALAALARLKSGALCADCVTDESTIRRALEALPND